MNVNELVIELNELKQSIKKLENLILENLETAIPAKEVETKWGLSKSTWHRLCEKGMLKKYKIGNKVFFKKSDLMNLLLKKVKS